jgi:hypothetical protein
MNLIELLIKSFLFDQGSKNRHHISCIIEYNFYKILKSINIYLQCFKALIIDKNYSVLLFAFIFSSI